jgi:signal transduction histidine kinase/DNA-binding NarL/FixJ family response regulator
VTEVAAQKLLDVANLPNRLVGVQRHEEQQRLAQLEISLEIGRHIGSILDRWQLSHEIERLICASYDYDHAQIFLWQEAEQLLVMDQPEMNGTGPLSIPLAEAGVLRQVVQRNELIFIPDAQNSPRFSPDPRWPDVRSRVILPIRLGERLVGLLDLHSDHLTNQTRQGLVGLKAIAAQFGIAIRNAELYSEALEAKAKAEVANQAKGTFLANMSHELRSPLHIILGVARLANQQPGLPSRLHDDLNIILHSGEHLYTLINQVLDLSKIEAGRSILHQTTFNFYYLLSELEDMFRIAARDKGLAFFFYCGTDVPRFIVGDQVKLRQVLINLLSNALKFTTEGSITLRVSTIAQNPASTRESQLLFSVADTGPGIAADEIDDLFNPFVQAAAGQQSDEGTGLGLAISRSYVRLMGGELRLDSQLGTGTTAVFDIPVGVVDTNESARLHDSPSRRVTALAADQPLYRILIVDDRWEARQLLNRLLAVLGFELREASNGYEAIDVWKHWQPHLVLMDLRMPGLDGYETTRRIRFADKTHSTVIIALTASSYEEERKVVLAAGCDDFLRKPFHESDLFDLLHKHLGIDFQYEEIWSPTDEALHLDRHALATLPDALLTELETALTRLDIHAIEHTIDDIRPHDPHLSEVLTNLAKDFQYEKVLRVINEAHNATKSKT